MERKDERGELVAADDLTAGAVVLRLEGPVAPGEAVSAADRAAAGPLGGDRWLIPSGPAGRLGRAADPSCAVAESLEVVTLRPLARGEALTLPPGLPAGAEGPSAAAAAHLRVGAVSGKGRGVFAGRRFR